MLQRKCQRLSSIQTRIKTVYPFRYNQFGYDQRPFSTKTRIKTLRRFCGFRASKVVRDHLPFKQGLRQVLLWNCNILKTWGQRLSSIQTRISSEFACKKELATLIRFAAIPPLKSKGSWSHLLIWV